MINIEKKKFFEGKKTENEGEKKNENEGEDKVELKSRIG